MSQRSEPESGRLNIELPPTDTIARGWKLAIDSGYRDDDLDAVVTVAAAPTHGSPGDNAPSDAPPSLAKTPKQGGT
jgi:hypothetical protein